MEDFESPEAEKDFPGLYTAGSSKHKKEDSSSDTLKKDKKKEKNKDKDKGYAALMAGDSSPEEEDTKYVKTYLRVLIHPTCHIPFVTLLGALLKLQNESRLSSFLLRRRNEKSPVTRTRY